MKKVVILFIVNSKFSKTANLAFPLYKEFFKENPTIKFEDFSLQLNNLVKDGILQKNAGPKGETYKLTWKAEEPKFIEHYLSGVLVDFGDLSKKNIKHSTVVETPSKKQTTANVYTLSRLKKSFIKLIVTILTALFIAFLIYYFKLNGDRQS